MVKSKNINWKVGEYGHLPFAIPRTHVNDELLVFRVRGEYLMDWAHIVGTHRVVQQIMLHSPPLPLENYGCYVRHKMQSNEQRTCCSRVSTGSGYGQLT
jgi:hypothetical protein